MSIVQLVKKMIDQELDNLHVALPARIEKYDPVKLRAEVTLLNKQNLEDKEVAIPPIIECPVRVMKAGSFVIRPPYKKGDTVQILFNEKALDQLLITGKPESVQFKRRHSLDDAVIIGGLQLESEDDLPESFIEDLLVMNRDTEDYLVIKKDGGVDVILGSESIVQVGTLDEIKKSTVQGVTLGQSHKNWADNHKHIVMVGGNPVLTSVAQTAPGEPDPCPEPSKRVLVT